MSYLDTYRRLLDARGGSIAGSQKETLKQNILNNFFNSPSYYQVTINNSPTLSDVWIVDDSELKEQKVLTTKPDSIVLNFGDKILWNGVYWLTIIVDSVSDVYYRGTIRRCIDTIKWMDDNGDIKEEPFYVTTEYARSLGLSQDNYLIIGDERRYIAVQSNSDTLKLKKNQRFIFDGGRCWRVDSMTTMNTGLIQLSLQESQIDPKDNVELGVCGYVTHTYTLTITNGSSLSLTANSTLQLNTTVTDNGSTVSSPTITYTSNDPTIATVTNSGLITALQTGSVTITVALSNDASVNATVSVNVSDVVSDSYSLSVSGGSTVKVSQSATYTSTLLNNGVSVSSQPATWSVSDSTLATITSQSNDSCTIQTNSNNKLGTVTLKVQLNSDSSVYATKQIQIKGLF